MKAHFEMMAGYNVWANDLLFAAVADLTDEQYRQDCGAFFGSVHGTLNHLFVADVIWMSRFRGAPNPPWQQDHIAHPYFDELRARRKAMDHDIIAYVGSLGDADLPQSFTFTALAQPIELSITRSDALAQFFNHHTHHRGQCHALLTRLTGHAPALDLIFYQRAQIAEGS